MKIISNSNLVTPSDYYLILSNTSSSSSSLLFNKYKFLVLSLIWLTLLLATNGDEEAGGVAYQYRPDEYPSLVSNPKLCAGSFRNPPTSVCDPDNIIKPEDAKKLDQLINVQQNETACLCPPCSNENPNGLLIKIALVRSINLAANQSIEKSVEQFADRTRLKWNLAKTCHHDVLVFVAITYNKVVISMGTKAENVIGMKEAQNIIENTQKHFSRNYIYEGLDSIVSSLQNQAQEYDPRLDRFKLRQGSLWFIILGAILLIIIVIVAYIQLKREKKNKTKLKNQDINLSDENLQRRNAIDYKKVNDDDDKNTNQQSYE
ncbi:hypothetical protein DERF_004346 [Dermatophagoides farinae]|uniref:TPM domain-containing protein n=1 Tax=Dermatophagoides farinae TaxID=6954 RepID=A0A922L522_DERFA|nr:hypothetical protein DERF_004346 [Dermatophagoides farinae]